MDTYDRLMRGGKEGAVIIPGKPERSILLERITLPPDHKKFMPSEGQAPFEAGRNRLDQGLDSAGSV